MCIRDRRQASRGNSGPELYQLSLYIMCVLLAVGLVANVLVRPVAEKWFEDPETVQAKVEADRASARESATTASGSGAGSVHALVAAVLALVIAALLVYGLWETAVKASQMFAG